MCDALREYLAERDVGILWLLLFRWATIVLAVAQSALVDMAQLAEIAPELAVVTLYTLALTVLAVRPEATAQRVLRSRADRRRRAGAAAFERRRRRLAQPAVSL